MQDESWYELVCESYSNPPVMFNGRQLPAFPPDQLQINTTGQAGPATLAEAFRFYEDCRDTFSKFGNSLNQESQLLDFGTGWGRIARFFLHDLTMENISGLDVTPDFVRICRETFASDNFHVTTPFPPTTLAAGAFSHIVGYSVFSHLSEAAALAWIEEFHRLLKPGGMVAVTTRGRPFFDFCKSLKGQGHTGYLAALSELFENIDAERKRYDRGEFIHSNRRGVTGGGEMNETFYGETFIPRQYAEKAFIKWFDLLEFQYIPDKQSHPILFFKKK